MENEDAQFDRAVESLRGQYTIVDGVDYEVTDRTTPGGNQALFLTRPSTNDGAIAYGLLTQDEYRLESLRPLTGWVIDIGAHIGTIAVALALDNPDLKVVAVEALPQNAAALSLNVLKNGLTGRVFVEALGATDDHEEPVDVTYGFQRVAHRVTGEAVDINYLTQCRYIGNVFVPDDSYDQVSETVTVPGISLAGIMAKYHMDRVALLKIDCEGCEWQFFRSKAIDKVDRIVGEYHDTPLFSDLSALLDATHVCDAWTEGAVGLFSADHR